MAARVEQSAIVVLAVDLDRRRADVAEQRRRDRRGADERAAAAVGLERAADQQRLAGIALDPLLGEQAKRGMIVGEPDFGGDRRHGCARANQAAIGAKAQRQAERVEQDRLARAGLSGEHAEPGLEVELEALDEHDIPDFEVAQHGDAFGSCRSGRPLTRGSLRSGGRRGRLGILGSIVRHRRRRGKRRLLRVRRSRSAPSGAIPRRAKRPRHSPSPCHNGSGA